MADCNHLFEKFYKNSMMGVAKRENLISGRDALRSKIEKHFTDVLKRKKPEFKEQGSYAQKTIINPPTGGEYDLDDGVYLQDLDKSDKSKWSTTAEVHKWVLDAVEGHADDEEDRNNCVRVIYKNDYHIDLPIYAECAGVAHLAKKDDGWVLNEPEKLTDWINDKIKNKGEQLRRLIRFFKAWKDEKNQKEKMPNGLYLTVLVIDQFLSDQGEDVSFQKTIESIQSRIKDDDEVKNPVNDDEKLSDRLSDAQKKTFKKVLDNLKKIANDAIASDSQKKACEKWKKELGEHFPACENCDESDSSRRLITSAPAILRDDKRSA